jgi:hypothetical protein
MLRQLRRRLLLLHCLLWYCRVCTANQLATAVPNSVAMPHHGRLPTTLSMFAAAAAAAEIAAGSVLSVSWHAPWRLSRRLCRPQLSRLRGEGHGPDPLVANSIRQLDQAAEQRCGRMQPPCLQDVTSDGSWVCRARQSRLRGEGHGADAMVAHSMMQPGPTGEAQLRHAI